MRSRATASLPRLRRRGFTIVELLVACAITVVLAGLAIGLISSSLSQWDRAGGLLTAEAQARQVFDLLARDIEGARLRSDGNVWMAATIQPGVGGSGVWVAGGKPSAASLNPAAANLLDARFGEAAVWLRMITSAPAAPAAGEESTMPVAISYQIIRRPPTSSARVSQYSLYRTEVTPQATFTTGYNLDAAEYVAPSNGEGTPGNIRLPVLPQLIANHVIDFGVRCYAYAPDVADGTLTLQRIFPVDANDLDFSAHEMAGDGGNRRLPEVIDVMLRVLTPEGARQTAAFEAGQFSGDWWEIATSHSVVFSRRIRLTARPI